MRQNTSKLYSEKLVICMLFETIWLMLWSKYLYLTPATPIFLSHHHLFILFSSREEGHSLAQAEAALSACVMLYFGALKRFISLDYIFIQTPPNASNKLYSLSQLTWGASLLPLLSTWSPPGCIRSSGWVGPWEPLRLVTGQGSFRYSDTNCKTEDTSSGTATPSASRICHMNRCHSKNE